MGLPIAIGSAQLVEKVNSALVGGVVLAFGALLFLGVPQVQPELLAYADAPEVINPNPNPNPSPSPNPNSKPPTLTPTLTLALALTSCSPPHSSTR